MSALDDLIARDSAVSQPNTLDSLIARDSAPVPASAAGGTGAAPAQPAAGQAPGYLESLGAGLGHGVGTTVLGAQQLLGHGAKAIGLDRAGDWLTNDANTGIKNLDSQYSPYSAANPITAGAGNIGGMIAATAPTMMVGPEFSALSLPGKIGLGAAQGAAGAAMAPVQGGSPDDSFAQQKLTQMGIGAGLGAALPVVAQGAVAAGKGLWNVAKPIVQPGAFVGQGLSGAMDPAAAAAAASNIRSAPQYVPGSIPTTAQAGANPVLVQTEKAAANLNPDFQTALMQRGIENNQARLQAVQGVAQTPADLQAAVAARSATVNPLYTAAHAAAAPVDPAFTSLIGRPSVQTAMGDANKLAAEEGATLQWPTDKNPQINGQALDYLGRALGDQISVAQRAGSAQQVRALTKTAESIDQWGQQNIPAIAQARAAYAQGSVPVNTMEAGQDLLGSLQSGALNANGDVSPTLAAYRGRLAQALKGQQYGIDPSAQQTLQNVQNDLQRATISNSVGKPGSDTAYNIAANGWLAKQLYGPSFNGATGLGKGAAAAATAFAGHPVAALGVFGAGNKLGQAIGSKLQGKLSNYLLDPQSLLPYLDARASATGQAMPNAVVKGLLNYGRPAVLNGLLGGLINAPQ